MQVVDTAGLRETEDPIEREGTRRAEAEAAKADVVLWLYDARDGAAAARAAAEQRFSDASAVTVVLNKIDLVEGDSTAPTPQVPEDEREPISCLRISALTGAGFESLIRHLKEAAGWREGAEGTFTARRRHLDALGRARESILAASASIEAQPEVAAEELRLAQSALSELTGELTSDDLLGEIFSSFCIGK